MTKHETILQTGITCKKIPLRRSTEFDMVNQFSENLILIFGLRKKMDKSKFVTKSMGIIIRIKKFFFFTDHLNHNTINKAICRTASASPRQICVH